MEKKTLFARLFSRMKIKLPGAQDPAPPARPVTPALKLVFFIVDWNQAPIISSLFVEEKIRFHFVTKGMGTAKSEVLDMLGIGAGDKAVILCLEQAVLVPVLMKEARKKLKLGKSGTGITFTIPLSAINDPILLVFKQSIHKNEKIAAELGLNAQAGEGEHMTDTISREATTPDTVARDVIARDAITRDVIACDAITHDLIAAIVNQGYSDEFMNTAREAGASGGTVINARGQAHEGAVKFFGISVQEEREVILILTSREKKVDIMRAVCEAHGLNSNAHGLVFSLPVDNVMGLNLE